MFWVFELAICNFEVYYDDHLTMACTLLPLTNKTCLYDLKVVIVDVTAAEGKQLAKELNEKYEASDRAHFMLLDVSSRDLLEGWCAKCLYYQFINYLYICIFFGKFVKWTGQGNFDGICRVWPTQGGWFWSFRQNDAQGQKSHKLPGI